MEKVADNAEHEKRLIERVQSDLGQAQHRYGIQDPFNDAKWYKYTANEIVEQADKLGSTRVQGYTADRAVSQINKIDGVWTRDDGKTLAEIQSGIDAESVEDILSRAELRAKAGPDLDHTFDRKLALADASAFLRIQDPELQERAAVAIADNAREYPHYKTGLEVAYTGYLRNPPEISAIAKRVAELDAISALRDSSREQNIVEQDIEPESQRQKAPAVDMAEAIGRAAENRRRDREQLANEQDRLGGLAEGKRIDVENLSEKATEQDQANDVAERLGNPTDRPDQQLTEREKNRQIELMEQLHHQFRVSGTKFHFKDQPGQIAFKDKGEKIVSASNDERVAKAMATMAEAKGWKTIKVSGHPDFQREVWMEASLRGLEVRGFKPNEQDLKLLDARRERTMSNVVEQGTARSRDATTEQREQGNKSSDKAINKPEQQAETKSASNGGNRVVTGRVVEHGSANFNHDPDEKQSYFVKLATKAGEKTIWGIDLGRAMDESKAVPGDSVQLEYKGNQPVTVDALVRNDAGKVVGKEQIQTNRNTWEVQISEKGKVVQAVAGALIDSKVKDPASQQALKAAVDARLVQREQAGRVPEVPVYDHNAAKQQPQQERISPQVERTERTR